LQKADWPINAYDFVRKTALEHASPKTKLYTVIAEAFNDEYNP